MFASAKERTGPTSALRRVVYARPRASRLLRRMLIGVAGVCMLSTLTASAGVVARASASKVPAKAAVAQFPLSVRQIVLRKIGGRIVGNATIANLGNSRVRPTTGLLGLRQGSGHRPTGLRAFSVPALRPRSSTKVRLTTQLVGTLRVSSGKYQTLICTDIYSQIRRFAPRDELLAGRQIQTRDKQAFDGVGPGAEHNHANKGRPSKRPVDGGYWLRFDD